MADSNLGWYAFNPVSSQQADFQVVAIDGFEYLGGSYHFDIDLASTNFDLDLTEFIGASAALSMQPWGGALRFFHGVVASAEMVREIAQGFALYRMRLVPRFAQFKQTLLNQAYLDSINGLALTDLIQKVCERQSFQLGQDYQLQLGTPITKRSFVMQYHETDWDFLNRWVEFEGAFYYFQQGDATGNETVVFLDDISSLPSNNTSLKYRTGGSIGSEQYSTALVAFGERHEGVAQNVTLQNYNYRHAQDLVEVSVAVSNPGWGSSMFYGDDLRDKDQANSYATRRAQALDAQALVYRGKTLATGLTVGATVSVQDHPRKALNQSFRITQVHHRGSQAGFGMPVPAEIGVTTDQNYYLAEFEAIAANTPFRLPLRTPRPMIAGYLPAQVDSDDGETAAIDKYGRYKVQLLYDNASHDTMKGSAWVRMASPYEGPGQSGDTGMHFPLSRGAEVMLMFMDGDPDQPVIAGALNNSLTPSSVNDQNNTVNRIVSRLGNEMHLDDTTSTTGIRMQTSNGTASILIGAFGGRFGKGQS
jgi:type VI secretion system secreted protein VgrG